MKNTKIISLLIIICVIFTALNTKVFAAGSFSASLTPSSTRVGKGEEVTVTFKISGINVEGGIAAIGAVVKFDSDVLSLTKDDVTGLNGWSAEYFEDRKKITIDRTDVVTSDSEVAKLKFKVNSSTSATTAAIQLTSIGAGNADIDEEVKISDITTNISIGSSITPVSPSTSPSGSPLQTSSATPATNSPSPTINTQTPTPNNTNIGNGKTTIKDDDKIPSTGVVDYVLPLIFIIAGLSIISFVKYKTIDNK